MSRTIDVSLWCDLSEADKVPAVLGDLAIGYKGVWYQVDIGEDALKSVADLMAVVRKRGRVAGSEVPKVPGGRTIHGPIMGREPLAAGAKTPDRLSKERKVHLWRVRAWAQANGHDSVGPMGIVRRSIVDAYNEAHADDAYDAADYRPGGKADASAES